MFDGASDDDRELYPRLDPERLARMAEAGNWLHGPEPLRRRHVGQTVAKWIVVVAIAAAAAWIASDWATAALLDEGRLAAMSIRP